MKYDKQNPKLEQRHTVCRVCQVACDLVVTLEDGEVKAIHGNKNNPVYYGYSCIKGREAGAFLKSPARLLHSQERQPDGRHQAIDSSEAVQKVASRLKSIVDKYGPRSVALFTGTYCTINPLFDGFAKSFMRALGSPVTIDNITIDQPGKATAAGLHGTWLAGTPGMDEWDALLLVGSNPIISMNGGLGVNPARQLKKMKERGMKLVVMDPRRSECAAKADVHLQLKPGEDVTVLAGLIRQILQDDQLDHEFLAAETVGLETLRAAVEPYTPDMVAERAGINAEDLIAAANILGSASKGAVSCGTGANMSGNPTAVEYLGQVLTTLRGWRRRAGEELPNPGIFIEPMPPIAATFGPMPVANIGVKMEARGVTASIAGIPVSAVPDEILTPGEGQIRAMIVCGANPVLAWPDQAKTVEALADLELLVCLDPAMSATAEMADYVFAPKVGLECETNSAANEKWALGGPGWGYEKPYAQIEPPAVEPPEGSDLKEDWEFFFELAQAMDLQLKLPALSAIDPGMGDAMGTELDMSSKPTTSEAWAIGYKSAPVPYTELPVSKPDFVERPTTLIQPKPDDWVGSLDIGASLVMDILEQTAQPRYTYDNFPYRLISRRLNDVINSFGRDNPTQLRKWNYNPAFMHPADLDQHGINAGSLVEIQSRLSRIVGVVEVDESIKPGCIAMPGSWGRHPDQEQRPLVDGANTGKLVAIDSDLEPLTGQPLMSAIPVSIRALSEQEASALAS